MFRIILKNQKLDKMLTKFFKYANIDIYNIVEYEKARETTVFVELHGIVPNREASILQRKIRIRSVNVA